MHERRLPVHAALRPVITRHTYRPHQRPFTTRTAAPPTMTHLSIEVLIQHCRIQTEMFNRTKTCNGEYAYELFRRALVERDQIAWQEIFFQYAGLVERWIRTSSSFPHSYETSDFFVTAAFIRFWNFVTPQRFAGFPTVATLLQYLRCCAACCVIDSVRAQNWTPSLSEELSVGERYHNRSDEEALERITSEEFWHYIETLLRSEAERVVVIESFILGMKPGAIFKRHPHMFDTITKVYVVKRNVLLRLGNDKGLQDLMA